eukprot:5352884-Prymnesium_polylepis.1
MPYAGMEWADYAASACAALEDLRQLSQRGTRVALGCACHPRRCHATQSLTPFAATATERVQTSTAHEAPALGSRYNNER